MRLRGVSNVSLDAKGRFALPKAVRDQLEAECDGQVVVTADPEDPCLLIYPLPEYEQKEEAVHRLPNQRSDKARKIQRLFIGYAQEMRLDGNGRLLLNARQRQYAGLERRLVLIGQGNKLELWSEGAWDAWLGKEGDAGADEAALAELSL